MESQNFLQFLDGKDSIIEYASVEKSSEERDEMQIVCYLTTEGVNKNNFKFTREVLANSYETFIGKPVIICPDENNLPTGHGYNYKTKKFDNNKRKIIGTITNAFLVLVRENGDVLDQFHFPTFDDFIKADGELRVIGHLNVWKFYFPQIAEKLDLLNYFENLCFSMEAVTDVKKEKGINVCTKATFQGVAVVKQPAFVNSKSIYVCEETEEEIVELQEALQKLEQVNNEKVELAESNAKLTNEAKELRASNQELSEKVVSLSAQVGSLEEYRTKYEAMQKEKLGQERMTKLEKLGKHDYTVEVLGEKTDVEFAEIVLTMVSKLPEQKPDVVSPIIENHKSFSNKETLAKFLGGKN